MRRRWRWVLALMVAAAVLAVVYVRTHPLIFNESFWGHARCVKIAGVNFHQYAEQHGGRFPVHPGGYGNALLLMDEDIYFTLTGPGYDVAPFYEIKRTGGGLPEAACGRVYVQGLSPASGSETAILFDKQPTPGGDHCHTFARLFAPLGREVLFVDGSVRFVAETDWPEFARGQVELLMQKGYPEAEARRLYATTPGE